MPDLTIEEIEALYVRGEKPRQKPRIEVRDWQPDDKLTRLEASVALDTLGYSMNGWPISHNVLGKMAIQRVGPPYSRLANRTFYRYGDLLDWAEKYADRRPA